MLPSVSMPTSGIHYLVNAARTDSGLQCHPTVWAYAATTAQERRLGRMPPGRARRHEARTVFSSIHIIVTGCEIPTRKARILQDFSRFKNARGKVVVPGGAWHWVSTRGPPSRLIAKLLNPIRKPSLLPLLPPLLPAAMTTWR